MNLNIEGKKAWILGASKGMGLAIAENLLKEKAQVFISSRNQENVDAALSILRKTSNKVSGLCVDMSSEDSIQQAQKELKNEGIDILICNSGGPISGLICELKISEWDKAYQELFRSVFCLTQFVLPHMKEKKWGRILHLTSTTAIELIPKLPISGFFRAGLSSWVKSLAKEVGEHNILVNNLLPGPTDTDRLKHLETANPSYFETLKTETAIKRLIKPSEIADVATFLVSDKNSVITGTDVLVDGGYTKAL